MTTDVPYLSPAFSLHSPDEWEFLRTVHDGTAFSLFWIDIVKPLLQEARSRHLLEIGAAEGTHTRWLLEYCTQVGGRLTVVEPDAGPSLRALVDGLDSTDRMSMVSRDALKVIKGPVDAVLLEGDLNYATVLEDLRGIEGLSERLGIPFPLVCFASASWPYARRDMYYGPDRLPDEAVHEHARMGMTPWRPQLEEGMINHPFENATTEGGPRNGVLTAAEDFLRESSLPLELSWLPANHGLGIIYRGDSPEGRFVTSKVLPRPALARFLETWELARINTTVRRLERERQLASWPATLRRIARRLRR